MPDSLSDQSFAHWWVSAVGRPPIAGESEIYAKTEALFEYAKQLEELNLMIQEELHDAREISHHEEPAVKLHVVDDD